MENEIKLMKQKNWIIGVLILLGIAVTIDLAVIYYFANFDKYAMPSFCSVSELIDCDGVARTVESQFLGVPLAYWGLFLYLFMGMLLVVDKLKKVPFLKFLEVFKNKFHYIASLGIISFTISIILLFVSLFKIQKICVMCAVTYVINLMIAITAVWGIRGNFVSAIKQSFIDFCDGLKPLPYRIAFVVVMICAGAFLGWTYTSAKFSPALSFHKKFGEFINAKENKYAVEGNVLGSADKDAVILHIYSDYKCPICYTNNIMLHKLVREFKNLRIEHHEMPLDISCNKYLSQEFHRGSCILAQYAIAAEKQGKFWEVHSLLFQEKPSTEPEILDVLSNSKFNLDMNKLEKDAHSSEVKKEIQTDIDFAASHNMMGTPSMRMDNEFNMGVKGYPDLKKWVIKHGAEPKHSFFQ